MGGLACVGILTGMSIGLLEISLNLLVEHVRICCYFILGLLLGFRELDWHVWLVSLI